MAREDFLVWPGDDPIFFSLDIDRNRTQTSDMDSKVPTLLLCRMVASWLVRIFAAKN